MNARLTVESPGALATIQDLGRPGWRRFGVPRSGALAPALLRIANALAGNAQGAPAIEFFVAGPTLAAGDAPVRLAFAGDFAVVLTRTDGTQNTIDSWRSVTLKPGEKVRAGQPRANRVGCIAVDGLECSAMLGSASTYPRARMGGLKGTALAAKDQLVAASAGAKSTVERVLREVPRIARGPIRVVLGPQADYFDAAAIDILCGTEYTVSSDADRMGVRLHGAPLRHDAAKGAEIVSDATVPGSIQVPGNGLPIVLLADGQTAGGYPKIATVASVDLPRLAVANVGTRLRFAAVSVAEAEALARAEEAKLVACLRTIGPLLLDGDVDLESIYGSNLISGMIDAHDPP